jgi:hypothetical protein
MFRGFFHALFKRTPERHRRASGICATPHAIFPTCPSVALRRRFKRMSRSRPAFVAPKRVYRTPESRKTLAPAMIAKRTGFGDFSDSGRRQCEAIAKTTGKRCGRDACDGSNHCWNHGASKSAGKSLARGAGRASKPASIIRHQIALLGALPLPEGFPGAFQEGLSFHRRGLIVEAWHNRESAPSVWHALREFVVMRK